MNKNKLIILLIIINLLLIGFCLNNNSNIVLSGEKQIIKEMTEIEYESKLTELNKSHEDYATNVQNYKKQIAEAITNQGVSTSEDATSSVMAENIGKILQVRTKDATATSEDIIEGKTAYINGELITGSLINSVNNGFKYNLCSFYNTTATDGSIPINCIDTRNINTLVVTLNKSVDRNGTVYNTGELKIMASETYFDYTQKSSTSNPDVSQAIATITFDDPTLTLDVSGYNYILLYPNLGGGYAYYTVEGY